MLICVFDKFISVPVPFAIDFSILFTCLFVNNKSSFPSRFECFNLTVKGHLFFIAKANFDFWLSVKFTLYSNKLSFFKKNYIKFKLVAKVFHFFVLILLRFREEPMLKCCNQLLQWLIIHSEKPVLKLRFSYLIFVLSGQNIPIGINF